MDTHKAYRFIDYLTQLPAQVLFERFFKMPEHPRKIISASMIQETVFRFSMGKNLSEAFSSLSREAQFFVSLIYLFGPSGIPFEYAVRCIETSGNKRRKSASPESGGNFPGFDDEILSSFLVYAATDTNGALYYMGFEEFEPKLRALFCRTIFQNIQVQPQKETCHSLPRLFCLNDVAVLVALASQRKLFQTKTGTLSKLSDQAIKKLLHGAQPSFSYGLSAGGLAAIVIKYALRKGLIFFHEGNFSASHERMCAWISQSMRENYADFLDFIIAETPVWRKSLSNEMLFNSENAWFSTQGFGESLKSKAQLIVKTFAYLGLANFRKSGDDLLFTGSGQRFEWAENADGKADGGAEVVVMPNFSALLPQEASPENLYWFSKIGRLNSLDKVYNGNISKEVIFDSLSEGIDEKTIMELLAQWRSAGNVKETVKEWIREFFRVELVTGDMLLTADQKVTRQLSSYEPLKGCLQPIQNCGVFKVVKGKEKQVAQLLADMGFDHRSPLMHQSESVSSEPGRMEYFYEEPSNGPIFSPVLDFAKCKKIPDIVMNQGKYSSQLQSRELPEIIHIIDYALLMGNRLRIEYAGSPGIRKGVYLVHPISYKKSDNSILEAETGRMSVKKIFLIDRIGKIGVETDHEHDK
jgi:hypothetical protein